MLHTNWWNINTERCTLNTLWNVHNMLHDVLWCFIFWTHCTCMYTCMAKLGCICFGLKEANAVASGSQWLSTQPGWAMQLDTKDVLCHTKPYLVTYCAMPYLIVLCHTKQCCGALSDWNKTKYSQLVTDSLSFPTSALISRLQIRHTQTLPNLCL